MWERACDQLRRHTGRLLGTGDSAQESICVQRQLCLDFLERSLFSHARSDLVLISDDIALASLDWSVGHGISWRLRGEGNPMRVLSSETICLSVQDFPVLGWR